MPVFRPHCLAIAAALACLHAQAADEAVMPTVVIKGDSDNSESYAARKSASSTGLDLSLRDTPQSVSVVTRARMDDFQLNTISDVLQNTTGVTVEKIETDRTYYTARGFDITNFQYDGVGIPFVFGNVGGDIDTALYERIDIVRGANGLMSGTGNPSATVNFIRKRPTASTQASASATIGSWNQRRVQGDLSGALNAAGTVTARVIAVHDEGDSYLDRYSKDRNVLYAIVEARLASGTTLTAGHMDQRQKTRGGLWGALPLTYSDGSPVDFDNGTSTSTSWARNKTGDKRSFAELVHRFGNGWHAQATLSRNTAIQRGKLFYVYGLPERDTGLGLYAYPSRYDSDNKQTLFNASAGGQFSLGGRRHELSFGGSWSKSSIDDISHYGQGIGTALPALPGWNGAYPEPSWDAAIDGSAYQDKRKGAFVAARFNLADNVKLVGGISRTKADSAGTAYGVSRFKSASKSTPYAGLVVDLAPHLSAYGSYTEIFNPQSETGIDGQTLDPMRGKTAELGLKSEWFDKRLSAAASVFKTRQQNTAEQAGYVGAKAYHRGVDAESQGVEFDLSGELARGLQATAGLTVMSIEDAAGKAAKTYLPRRTLRLSATYQVPALPALKVGATASWQDGTRRDEADAIVIRQGGYAVLGLMAQYELNNQLSLRLNVANVADKKYLTSLYWSQGYYAAPRNASATLTWKY